jgi:hypothetical protein
MLATPSVVVIAHHRAPHRQFPARARARAIIMITYVFGTYPVKVVGDHAALRC